MTVILTNIVNIHYLFLVELESAVRRQQMTPFQIIQHRHKERKLQNQLRRRVIFNEAPIGRPINPNKSTHQNTRPKPNREPRRDFRLTLSDFVTQNKSLQAKSILTSRSPLGKCLEFFPTNITRNTQRYKPRAHTNLSHRVFTSPIHSECQIPTPAVLHSSRIRAHTERKQQESNVHKLCYRLSKPSFLPEQDEEFSITGTPKAKFTIADVHYDKQYEKLLSVYNSKYSPLKKPSNRAKPCLFEKRKKTASPVKSNRIDEITPWCEQIDTDL